MVNRVWLGIAPGADAANPYDWGATGGPKSPPGVPQPGDSLYMYTGGSYNGTMNVSNYNLAGDTLTLSTSLPAAAGVVSMNPNPPVPVHATPTVNLYNSAVNLRSIWNQDPAGTVVATVNVRGFDAVNYTGDSRASVISNGYKSIGTNFNILNRSILLGTITTGAGYSFVNVSGPGKFAPSSVVVGDGCTVAINSDVIGYGTITAGGYHPPSLKFGGKVGNGITVNLNAASLEIDRPGAFQGTVVAAKYQDNIHLVGLTGADSWSLRNDMLAVFSHGHPVEAMHLVTNGYQNIGVYQSTAGVEIDFGISGLGVALHHIG